MKRILDAIPYARFLGVDVTRSDGALELLLPFRNEIVGNARLPAVHGGVLGAFLELTALLRLIDESGTDRVPKPITSASTTCVRPDRRRLARKPRSSSSGGELRTCTWSLGKRTDRARSQRVTASSCSEPAPTPRWGVRLQPPGAA